MGLDGRVTEYDLVWTIISVGVIFVQVYFFCDFLSKILRYLTEVEYKRPVIVYDYPKGIKAFYMGLNGDGETVAAMDVLVPKVCFPFYLNFD